MYLDYDKLKAGARFTLPGAPETACVMWQVEIEAPTWHRLCEDDWVTDARLAQWALISNDWIPYYETFDFVRGLKVMQQNPGCILKQKGRDVYYKFQDGHFWYAGKAVDSLGEHDWYNAATIAIEPFTKI